MRATGSFRFEITGEQPERWFVEVKKGDVTVSRRNVQADCMMRADRAVFEAIMSGEANAFAAALRGAAVIDGNVSLLAMFQRLLPGPLPGQA
jgi:putative sterol carrier protein